MVALVAACEDDEGDPRYVGKYFSPNVFVSLEHVEGDNYLANVQMLDEHYMRWEDSGVFDAEVVNGKFLFNNGVYKESWKVSEDGLMIDFPERFMKDGVRIPDDWDQEDAKAFMPDHRSWREAIENPNSWKLKLKEEAGVEVGI